jgi:hypothetical protein
MTTALSTIGAALQLPFVGQDIAYTQRERCGHTMQSS